MKSCIILRSGRNICTGHVAYNENGMPIIKFYDYDSVQRYVEATGFCVVPLNSRCGRTILDKVNGERV